MCSTLIALLFSAPGHSKLLALTHATVTEDRVSGDFHHNLESRFGEVWHTAAERGVVTDLARAVEIAQPTHKDLICSRPLQAIQGKHQLLEERRDVLAMTLGKRNSHELDVRRLNLLPLDCLRDLHFTETTNSLEDDGGGKIRKEET